MMEPLPEVASAPPAASRSMGHGRDIALLIFFLLALLVLLGRGIYVLVTGLSSPAGSSNTDLASSVYDALSMLFCALLVLPAVVLTIRHLQGRPLRLARIPGVKVSQIIVLLIAWIAVIVASIFINKMGSAGWIVGGPLFLLGIALPVVGLLWIAMGGLPTGSWRRLWDTLGLGLTAGPFIAIFLELLIGGVAVLLLVVVALVNPALRTTLEQLRSQLNNARDIQSLMPFLTPYLNNPWVFLGLLLFASGFGPLIEEAAKPLAVWLVGKRLNSPAEGFALGALCGAGFALIEGLLAASGSADMLGVGLAGRATSSVMHITASALMGWGMASALLQKRYGRLAWVYLASVTLHGLWNGAVLLTVFGGLRAAAASKSVDLLGGLLATVGIAILGMTLLAILIVLPILNHRLRPAKPPQNDIIAPTIS